MTPKLERWANWFVVIATLLMFAEFLVDFHRHHRTLDWALFAGIVLFVLVASSLRYLRVANLVNDVYQRFAIHENVSVWRRARHTYKYIGVSGATFLTEFRTFTTPPKNGLYGTKIQFLLLRPDPTLVLESRIHETGREMAATDESVTLTCSRIRDTASAYLALEGLNIEIRFYDEICRYWAHLIDDNEIYLSPLLRRQSGLESMVLRLAGGAGKNLLIRYYLDEFERLWNRATPAATYLQPPPTTR